MVLESSDLYFCLSSWGAPVKFLLALRSIADMESEHVTYGYEKEIAKFFYQSYDIAVELSKNRLFEN